MSITIGNVKAMQAFSFVFNPASILANTTAEQTVTVPGLEVGDHVIVQKPTLEAGIGVVGTRVSAANTLAITFVNATGSAVDAGSETWNGLVFKPELPVPNTASI